MLIVCTKNCLPGTNLNNERCLPRTNLCTKMGLPRTNQNLFWSWCLFKVDRDTIWYWRLYWIDNFLLWQDCLCNLDRILSPAVWAQPSTNQTLGLSSTVWSHVWKTCGHVGFVNIKADLNWPQAQQVSWVLSQVSPSFFLKTLPGQLPLWSRWLFVCHEDKGP